jgi:hypothetical protein
MLEDVRVVNLMVLIVEDVATSVVIPQGIEMEVIIGADSIGGFSRQKNSRVEFWDVEGIGSSKPVQGSCKFWGSAVLFGFSGVRQEFGFPFNGKVELEDSVPRTSTDSTSCENNPVNIGERTEMGEGMFMISGRCSVGALCRNVSSTTKFHEFLFVQFGWLYRGSVGLNSKVKYSVLATRDNRGGDPRVAAMLAHCFGTYLG